MTTIEQPTINELPEALRTVAVNSAHRASRALSKWFKHGVRLTCDGFESVPISELAASAGDPDDAVVAIHMPLAGDMLGDVLLTFPEKVALSLVDVMIGAPDGTSTQFGELERSCLQETGNIVASAFCNSLAGWLHLDVKPLAPIVTHDLAAAVIQPLLVAHAATGDEALAARTEFEFNDRHLDWSLILLPSAESMNTMRGQCHRDRIQRHALHTIAVNGSFDASRAMSKWLHRGVRLSTEGFVRVPLRDACPRNESGEPFVALHLQLGNQLHGHELMLMSLGTARELVELLTQTPMPPGNRFDEMHRSALLETGNIIGSAFVNSWAKVMDIYTEPAAPQLVIDLPEAVFQSLLVEQAMAGDDVFLAKTEFNLDGRWLDWSLYILPSPSSLRLIEAYCE
ncbi:MAG: hypothetical protein HOP29_04450 [Phycisphaerales bacterium]|nr:hypothetical protein [Phycisphaerales bacterium]